MSARELWKRDGRADAFEARGDEQQGNYIATRARSERTVQMLLALQPAAVGLAVLIASSGGVPTINVKKTCQTSQQTISSIFGDQTAVTYDSCLNQEREARGLLEKGWASFPAADKALCVQSANYMPSYVEWLTCFEMQRDVRRIRNEGRTPRKAQSSRRS
jgi:hypothetical protein